MDFYPIPTPYPYPPTAVQISEFGVHAQIPFGMIALAAICVLGLGGVLFWMYRKARVE